MCGVCLFLAITLEGTPDIKKLDIMYSVYVPAGFSFSAWVCSSFITVKFHNGHYEALAVA